MIERRRAAAHAFVIDVNAPFLNDDDFHHLAKVLRLRSGESVSVSDGRGSWRICTYDLSAALAIDDSVVHFETNPRSLTVAFSVTKNDKPDLVIQKLTELGIDHIVPMITERSIVRWDSDKGAKNQARWQKIAREAAMQSRSVFLPTIHEVYPSIEKFVDTNGPNIAVADPEGGALTTDISTLVIGPEGGFTHQEMDLMPQRVSLPGGILRAETAAVAAGVMLSHMRSRHG
ncbi:MAG: RsmE family RNA methyltransferase [Actinomycetes bacterium]